MNILLSLLFLLTATYASAASPQSVFDQSEPVYGAWSPVVQGVRGRLVVTPIRIGGQAQLRLAFELENISDQAYPKEIAWGSFGEMLTFILENESGNAFPAGSPGGNELSIPTYGLKLPVNSTLQLAVSKNAFEYYGQKVHFRPLVFQAWDFPPAATKLFLRARLVPMKALKDKKDMWQGPLELPRVEIPSPVR